jgi:peptidoglycan/LPS O-acetylase OafA/YrhL
MRFSAAMGGINPVRRYIPTLDGWRAVAIGLVMLLHGADSITRALAPAGVHFDPGSGVGLLGVQIFFCLSGFLITTNLINEEDARGSASLRSFYIRRCFRILPAALTFLAIAGLLGTLQFIDVDPTRWVHTLLFMANYSEAPRSYYVMHFWSLAVEEHFYFIWPLAFILLRQSSHRLVLVVATIAGVALWRAIAFKYQITYTDSALFWGRTDTNADSLLFGVALALLFADPEWRARIVKHLSGKWAPLLGFGLVVCALSVAMLRQAFDWKVNLFLIDVQFLLIVSAIIFTVVNPGGWMGRLLESPPFRWVGRLSYSLYLYQQLFLVEDEWLSSSLTVLQDFPINIVAAVACALLSLHLIEKPMIRIGHRLATAKGQPFAMDAARV